MSAGLITIIGGSGYIGRHLTGKLAEKGYRIRLAVRDTEKAAQLMTQGDVGQVVGVQTNIRNVPSIERAVAGADVVINLVGLLYEAGAQKFDAVHAEGAGNVAAAAKAAGASQLIQMSALGADEKGESAYARTKAEGEARVKAAYPEATILRPSVVWGNDDDFTNKFAQMSAMMPALPLGEGGKNKMQPLWVEDLVDAIVKIVETPALQGKTYELGGPDALSMAEIIDVITSVTERTMFVLPAPYSMMGVMGFFMGLIPGKPMLTSDQVKLTKADSVVSEGAEGFAELGIEPKPFQAASLEYLRRFRKGGGLNELHA
ncbi:NAD(P)H-binding protein [Sneathiella sp. P13V-1]|uniref:complex I NDUFA9 subunit family protein n=1 Tax=Sneathiella sp. P13V-1 TaxID=2697366 RepID=UPI00187BB7C5|nr:complex I NDUFA9 subunit family protein [Sneathiella sp. P13V-1]MBE7636189.1 NAD(P)H-binding protein [Sneathiella sp. P13V-1]